MKTTILLLLTICTSSVFAQPKSFDYAYTHKKGICVYSIADKKEYFIIKDGADPCISPDGAKLAYTVNLKNGNRAIAVINLNTKATTSLNTNNGNCYGPVWSPDGQWIAYNAFLGDKWTIAIIGSNNTGAKLLGANAVNTYSPVWLANSKQLILQNQEKITVLDRSGNITATYNPKDLEGGIRELKDMVGSASSDKFILTADNSKIIFNCGVDLPGSTDGPPSAVFVYDIATKKTLQLSPKGYDAVEMMVKGTNVFFTGYKGKLPVSNIYSVDMDGSNFKLLFAGCSNITAKN
jgi:Tol biopolymer transport system component